MSKIAIGAAICLLFVSAAAFAADPAQMSVTVKETQLRATPSYLGKILAVLAYGDRVTILDQPADAPKTWKRVSIPEKKLQGWVSLSALTEKRIVLKAGSEAVAQGAGSGEVALAGKGFNESVEKEYRQEGALDYTWVDRMGQITVTPEQLAAFIKQGGLSSLEGGAQ
jgi:hypothetical protein